MADFLGNLEYLRRVISKKAGKAVDVVAQKAGETVDVISKKAEETVEITKIKSQINTMQRNNQRDYEHIGKMIYEKYISGEVVDAEYAELCEVISEREESIRTSKEQIAKLKGLEVCANCDARLEAGVKFCSNCGNSIE